MNEEFVYRKHIDLVRKINKIFYILILVIIIVAFLVLFFSSIFYQEFESQYYIIFVFYTAFIILILYFTNKLYKSLASLKLTITDDGIYYKNNKRDVFLRYEDITKIGTSSIKYTGGWLTIESENEKNIKLTVVLQDIEKLVLLLKEKLDELGLQELYDKEKFFSFYKTSVYSSSSWIRMYMFFPNIIYINLSLIFVAFVSTLFIHYIFLVYILSLIFVYAYYFIYEFLVCIPKIKHYVNEDTWEVNLDEDANCSFVKRLFTIQIATFVISYIIFVIFYIIR